MIPYYTLEEISQKSGLTRDQVLRIGFSGTLVFSVVRHTPRNYKEVDESKHPDGSKTVRTKTNETVAIVKSDGPALRLTYIATEDAINVVLNDAPNRKTLVRATYQTRELLPKQGTWQASSPLELTPSDLVIAKEEWEHFSKGTGKSLKNYLPLVPPERVTFRWLIAHVTVGQWLALATMVTAIFGSGIYFSSTAAYQQIKTLIEPASTPKVMLIPSTGGRNPPTRELPHLSKAEVAHTLRS